jgi:ethanolamine utilization protein EutP (predicted NTPase)
MESNKLKSMLCGCLLLLLNATSTYAQSFSFSDLFGQSKKEIKNLEQQIAALNALETTIRQGYNMLHAEWYDIANWKTAEFSSHQAYYSSLSAVKPVVSKSVDMTTITAQQQSMSSMFNSISTVNGLTTGEQTYVTAVQQQVLSECNKDVTDLQTALAPGQLVMTDDERIQRISKLTAEIKDQYVFTCTFCNQVRLLAASRTQDTNEIQTERSLYGIN